VISEPDVVARRDLIYNLLGDEKAQDLAYMRRRNAAHERLIMHMCVFYWSEGKRWMKKSNTVTISASKLPKSMKTKESREEYIEKNLKKEREAMGLGGSSKETAIELD
jgi:hypothetical protein